MSQAMDARVLREAMGRYLDALRVHREEINSLNVFPVPDGDTGTNMLLTQQAVEEALASAPAEDLVPVGEAISRAALMGARGNSGVILSQVLRGLCARMCREAAAGPADLAEGLAAAAEEARRAVAEPVEGTMLTVLRDGAEAAGRACRDGADCDGIAEAALAAAVESLEHTTEQLPALATAGVVDAGAKGMVLFFDALVSTLRGEGSRIEVGPIGPVGETDQVSGTGESTYGYEVMYLLESADSTMGPLRRRLGEIGDSLVVVGGGGLYNVHVHTDDPGGAVEVALAGGRPRNIRITSLDVQVESCLAGQARGVRVAEPVEDAPPGTRTAVVAVVPGEGIAALFRSLGAVAVPGGRGRNPSVGDLVESVAAAGGEAALLLPNHPDVRQAAEGAAAESVRSTRVVATSSVLEGLAAATSVVAEDDVEDNLRRAAEAARLVSSGEVILAARDTDTPAGRATVGASLGLVDEDVAVVDDDPVVAAVEVARLCRRERHEIATLLAGADVSDADAERAAEAVGAALEGVEVEWHRGGQDSPFLIGLE
ncbi:MAG: DAK2 domain-containing protein [Actinomycetota bacterium]